jgi:hypothetical protein
MAGAAKLTTKINITGLGNEVNIDDVQDVTLTVPVEHGGSGKYIVHATAQTTAIQLSDIFPQLALTKIYLVYIKAESGTIYVQVDTAGTTTFVAADAHLVINEGEGYPIPVNPDGNAGVAIDAASATDAFTITALAGA